MARLDTSVQVRVEMRVLATLAQHYYNTGNIAALKGTSALVRMALNDLVAAIIAMDGAEMCSAHDAEEVLGSLGLLPRVVRSSQLHNLEEEDRAVERAVLGPQRIKGPTIAPARGGPILTEAGLKAIAREVLGHKTTAPREADEGEVTENEADEGEITPSALRALRKGDKA